MTIRDSLKLLYNGTGNKHREVLPIFLRAQIETSPNYLDVKITMQIDFHLVVECYYSVGF